MSVVESWVIEFRRGYCIALCWTIVSEFFNWLNVLRCNVIFGFTRGEYEPAEQASEAATAEVHSLALRACIQRVSRENDLAFRNKDTFLIIGPIFHRELAVAPRRLRFFVDRAAYAAGFMILISTAWAVMSGNQVLTSVGDLARFGLILFDIMAPLQLAMVLFYAPILAASAVAQEKDKQTLILLLMTRLNNSELVLGKLLASLVQIVVLLLASLPIFSLVLLFGGVSFAQVFRVYAVTVVTAIAAGSLGTMMAFWREKTFQTLARRVGSFRLVGILGGSSRWIFWHDMGSLVVPTDCDRIPTVAGGQRCRQAGICHEQLFQREHRGGGPALFGQRNLHLHLAVPDRHRSSSRLESIQTAETDDARRGVSSIHLERFQRVRPPRTRCKRKRHVPAMSTLDGGGGSIQPKCLGQSCPLERNLHVGVR